MGLRQVMGQGVICEVLVIYDSVGRQGHFW